MHACVGECVDERVWSCRIGTEPRKYSIDVRRVRKRRHSSSGGISDGKMQQKFLPSLPTPGCRCFLAPTRNTREHGADGKRTRKKQKQKKTQQTEIRSETKEHENEMFFFFSFFFLFNACGQSRDCSSRSRAISVVRSESHGPLLPSEHPECRDVASASSASRPPVSGTGC